MTGIKIPINEIKTQVPAHHRDNWNISGGKDTVQGKQAELQA